MAKRFSETDKWNDEWFLELKPLQKLIFLYLVDRCDNAGFIEINTRVASFLIGITTEQFEQGLKGLDKCLINSNDGKKVWLKNFLFHQKNIPLNPANNAHKQILFLLNENQKKFTYDFSKLGANQGLISPLGIDKGKGNGIVEENVIDFFSIEDCLKIAMKDERWIRANKTNQQELEIFNTKLFKKGRYEMNPKDYKEYFSNWKDKGKLDDLIPIPIQQTNTGTGAIAFMQQIQKEALKAK